MSAYRRSRASAYGEVSMKDMSSRINPAMELYTGDPNDTAASLGEVYRAAKLAAGDSGTATRRRGKSDDNLWRTARNVNSSASSVGDRRRGPGDDGTTRGSRIRKHASGGVGDEAATEGQGMGSRRLSLHGSVRSLRTQVNRRTRGGPKERVFSEGDEMLRASGTIDFPGYRTPPAGRKNRVPRNPLRAANRRNNGDPQRGVPRGAKSLSLYPGKSFTPRREPSGRRSARSVNEKEADETHANDLNLFRKYRVMEPLFAKRTTSQSTVVAPYVFLSDAQEANALAGRPLATAGRRRHEVFFEKPQHKFLRWEAEMASKLKARKDFVREANTKKDLYTRRR